MSLRSTTPILPTESGSCVVRSEAGVWDDDARPLVNIAPPLDDNDAATKSYVDDLTGGSQFYGKWSCSTNTAMADPGKGKVRFDQAPPNAVTAIALSAISDENVDVTLALQKLRAGDRITVQDSVDATRVARYSIATLAEQPTWWQFGVTFAEGAGNFISGNNTLICVFTHFGATVAQLDARLAALENKLAKVGA